MNRIVPVVVLGLLVALAGTCFYLSPIGQKIEENIGLYLLFTLRGPIQPPESVAIVNLDDSTSAGTNRPTVSENFSKWPRSAHAKIVRKLKSWGVSVIAFDVHFLEHQNREDDSAFAQAIKEAGNVILFAGLKRETFNRGTPEEVVVENIIKPIPSLTESALAIAPFPLPKLPVRLNQTWTFKIASGEAPTLPVAALQAKEIRHYELLYRMIRESIPGISDTLPPKLDEALDSLGLVKIMYNLRILFQKESWLAQNLLNKLNAGSFPFLSSEETRALKVLIKLYGGKNSRFLNYYGPPLTLRTFSYEEILSPDAATAERVAKALKDKVVFIGASPHSSFGQRDGFYTVFSRPDGLDISGVELAATIFANLYDDKFLHPLTQNKSTLIIICCAFGAVLASFYLSPLQAAVLIIITSGGLFLSASYLFGGQEKWIPVITPFMLQPIVAFFAILYWKFLSANREKENISTALGFYLPERVVKELSRDPGFIKSGDKMVYSICLQTDAQHYTTLSEKTAPRELGNLMRDYYQHIFEPVKRHGGAVSDVVGDAMLAIWPSTEPCDDLREHACKAALEILDAADEFNRKYHTVELPTRIGLHYGYMLMGNIGAGTHYEYTPVGDIVNTTSRIEKLNKHMKTKVLATEETIQGLHELTTRKLGIFLLTGKSEPIVIHELMAADNNVDKQLLTLRDYFQQSMQLYMQRKWEEAISSFAKCLEIKENDGPALFYTQLCKTYLNNPPVKNWQGIVRIESK